jgi:hypothetical protein
VPDFITFIHLFGYFFRLERQNTQKDGYKEIAGVIMVYLARERGKVCRDKERAQMERGWRIFTGL